MSGLGYSLDLVPIFFFNPALIGGHQCQLIITTGIDVITWNDISAGLLLNPGTDVVYQCRVLLM